MRRIVLAVLLAAAPIVSVAQNYSFEVPTVLEEAWIEPDGSVTLEQTFDIKNQPGAKALDGVDVGMPTPQWRLDRVQAWIGDAETHDVVKSPYVDNGFAVNLPNGGLPPGEEAVVRTRVTGVGGLLFADTTSKDLVSMRLTPTWFDGQFLVGESAVRLVAHLPPGVPVESLKWQAVPWTGQVNVDETPDRPAHAAVVWERTYSFTGPWMVGLSFPRAVTDATGFKHPSVANVREITTWDLFTTWAGNMRGPITVAFLVVWSILFFWATRRTGCVPWFVITAIMFFVFLAKPVLPILLAPALPLFWWAVASSRKNAKRAYYPAVASVEGGGIKRGLTAPEAACLLEAPPEKILLLVLYGLSRKGLVELQSKEPKGLLGRTTTGFGLGTESDVKLAAEKGTVLHPYESAFLALLAGATPHDVGAIDWGPALRGLATQAGSRLKGYDLKQTKDYYEQIVARAWKEATTIGDVELRKQAVDRTFDWLVLDSNAYRRMDHWGRSGWVYRNPWIPGPRASTPPVSVGGGKTPPPLPNVGASDVAGSIGGRLETLSGGLASALGVGGAPKGVFSKVDAVSGDVFKQILSQSAQSSGRRGGGGGFSCACACAGCACACACAGGGR